MMSFTVFYLVTAICCAANANRLLRPSFNPLWPTGRIVGGEDTTIEDNPWQASLRTNEFVYCGASIVSPDWVITAAHCAGYPIESTTVKVGSTSKNAGGSVHRAIEIIRHENFTTNAYGIVENDVALIRISPPIAIDGTRRPIELFQYHEEAKPGILAIITGWGAIYEGGTTSEVLQTVRVPVVSKSSCNDAYSNYGGITEGQICAAHPRGGKDACQGDSGGPLTIGGRLAGIVSWGNGCARPGWPGVYTEIANYRNWIAEKIGI